MIQGKGGMNRSLTNDQYAYASALEAWFVRIQRSVRSVTRGLVTMKHKNTAKIQ